MSIPYEQKASVSLHQLGLDVAEQQLDQAAQQAAAAGWSYTHFSATCSMPRSLSAMRRRCA